MHNEKQYSFFAFDMFQVEKTCFEEGGRNVENLSDDSTALHRLRKFCAIEYPGRGVKPL